MLPSQHRMRRSADFTDAVSGGVRGGARRLVVHLRTPAAAEAAPAVAGFVVSKAVGNAVERNVVKRRLRGLVAERIRDLRHGEKLVVRALPTARGAFSAELGSDLDAAVDRARRRSGRARR